MRTARVGDLAEQLRGVTFAKVDASPDPGVGLLPILRAGNIQDGRLSFDDLVYVPASKVRPKQRVLTNDVVITASSGSLDVVGKAARSLTDFEGGFGAFLKVLRPGDGVDPAYFSHYFQTPSYRRRISTLASGANINNLKNAHLDDLEIPLPPLPEQRRIAAILDHADVLRAERRQILAHLDTLLQSIFHDMFGDPETWPSRWPMGVIGDMTESVQYGTSAKAGQAGQWPILRMGNVTDTGRLDLADLKYIDLAPADVARYTVRRGDMLFNRTNSKEKVGKTCVVHTDEPLAVAGYLVRVRFGPEHRAEYVSTYLTSRHGLAVRQRLAKAAVNQANINATEMRSISIALPPTVLQTTFAERLRQLEQQRSSCLRTRAADDELFASLQARDLPRRPLIAIPYRER